MTTNDIPLRAMAAIQNGELQSLKAWVDAGGDVYAKESTGENLMHKAAFYGQVAIAEYLKHRGLNIDSVDGMNFTPLHEASRAGNVKMVEWLLQAGADAGAKTTSGRTALDMAIENAKSEPIANLLRNLNVKTRWVLTGTDEITRVTPKPLINHTLTEVFNFSANTYLLITANDVTKAESTVFRTFSDFTNRELIDVAEAQFKKMGGVFPQDYDPADINKKKLPKPGVARG